MKEAEALSRFTPELLENLYGFAYARCQNHHEAEDLCSEIVLQLLKTIRRGREIENFEAFCWRVARNVYADFCEKKHKLRRMVVTQEELEESPMIQVNPVEEYLAENEEYEQLREIVEQIASLAKIYREVMIFYYLEEQSVSQIAERLEISETTVKQRLFMARNTLKGEMEQMQERELPILLKPIYINFLGIGKPLGNDPSQKAERLLSKGVVYMCRKKAYKASDIARELNVPLVYIEDELDILEKGANGTYGLVRRTGKDKYIANIILLEQEETQQIIDGMQKEMHQFVKRVRDYLMEHEAEFLSLPVLGKKPDLPYFTWSLLHGLTSYICEKFFPKLLAEQYFGDIVCEERLFSQIGLLCGSKAEEGEDFEWFYGMDEASATQNCGYRKIHFQNIYGKRLKARFHSDENIATNQELQLTVQAVKGLVVQELDEEEQEVAAKAIAGGYIVKENGILYPKIVTVTKEVWDIMWKMGEELTEKNRDILEKMASKIAKNIKRYVPKHLITDYKTVVMVVCSAMVGMMIEAGIQTGILSEPVDGSEGTVLWIEE